MATGSVTVNLKKSAEQAPRRASAADAAKGTSVLGKRLAKEKGSTAFVHEKEAAGAAHQSDSQAT